MKTFFASLAGAIVGVLLTAVIAVVVVGFLIGSALEEMTTSPQARAERDGSAIILDVDLRMDYNDLPNRAPLAEIFGGATGFIDIITRMHAVCGDDEVRGVFIRAPEYGIASARAEEVRSAIKSVQACDKFVIAHSQGTYAGGPSAYRAIAAADEIWIQPAAEIIAPGFSFETLFLKGLFDNLSINPEIEQFYEYKNAANVYKQTDYTDAHREAVSVLGQSVWEATLADIAEDRELTAEAVRTALEDSPLSADRLVELGLADDISWPEDVMKAARERAGDGAIHLDVASYTPPSAPLGAPLVAVVGGEGGIVTGPPQQSLFGGDPVFYSDTVARALLNAAEDEDVRAVVFRVDSPGGSATASDQVWRAVQRVRDAGKPVVVSMGTVAASGGYYVSTGADWIVANDSTITGSIGIFGGKFAIAEGLARIGVNAESIEIGGPFTGAFTSVDSLTNRQRVLLRQWLKRGYDRFIELVAEGRDMSLRDVQEIARGRVWTGEDALEQGLVDEIGGLMTAVDKARELAGIEEDAELRMTYYPKAQTLFGTGAGVEASQLAAIARLSAVLDEPQVKTALEEIEAARSPQIQARMPALSER